MPRANSSSRRRGNSEGSTPRRRPDGRWQINLRFSDEFGDSSRHTVYGDTAQDARDKAAGIRKRVEDGQPARDRRETVAAFTQHWIDTSLQASERKRNTKVMYAGVARTHILKSSIGRLPLDKVRPSHVEVVKMVVKPPRRPLRGRSGSPRTRPLTCDFLLSG